MGAKKEPPKFPPPPGDEPTGAAGPILVSFMYELMKHCLPVGVIEREIERVTGPLGDNGRIDEQRPLGAHARVLADKLVADMKVTKAGE